jgi:hypothetical protein
VRTTNNDLEHVRAHTNRSYSPVRYQGSTKNSKKREPSANNQRSYEKYIDKKRDSKKADEIYKYHR